MEEEKVHEEETLSDTAKARSKIQIESNVLL